MDGKEFRETLETLGIGQTELARWLDSDGSTVRRYIYGKRKVPTSLALLLEYLSDRPEAIQWFRDRAIRRMENDSASKSTNSSKSA